MANLGSLTTLHVFRPSIGHCSSVPLCFYYWPFFILLIFLFKFYNFVIFILKNNNKILNNTQLGAHWSYNVSRPNIYNILIIPAR